MQQPTTASVVSAISGQHNTSNNSNSSPIRQRHRSSNGDSVFKCNYCPKKYTAQGLVNISIFFYLYV